MSDIKHIAEGVERDRARLANTLDALTDTVAPQSIANEATSAATDLGADLAQRAWATLRENPAGGLLVAIGAGLLAAGPERRPTLSRTAAARTSLPAEEAMAGFDSRVAAADTALRSEMTGELDHTPEASQLKATLHTGLEVLPPAARKRVIEARQAALAAQESFERQTRHAARKTKGFVYEQPLTAGALALGFGVLAGTLLPGTRREDEMLGARRDALMAEARTALEEEMLKLCNKAERAVADRTGTNVHNQRAS